MKKAFQNKLWFLILISLLLFSCGHSKDEAIKFNNAILEQQTKVFDKENAIFDALNKNKPDNLDFLCADLTNQVDTAIVSVNKLVSFDSETGLKESTLNILKTYKEVLAGDYKDLIEYAKMPDSLYTQEVNDKFIGLSKKISDKLNIPVNAFIEKQKKFAEKYKFELTSALKEPVRK
jgi:hypothetical protein